MSGPEGLALLSVTIAPILESTPRQAAWQEFARRYEPRLLGWCKHWRLQEADVRDVTQTVLLQLMTKL